MIKKESEEFSSDSKTILSDFKVNCGKDILLKSQLKCPGMAMIGLMEQFDVESGQFVDYEERMSNYLKVNKVDEGEKAAYFLILAGPELYTILKSLTIPKQPKDLDYAAIVKTLTGHFAPKINKRVERFKFSQAVQKEGESIADFIVKLKSLAQSCKFGEFLDDALADKFIVGLKANAIQQEVLKYADEKFEKYCEVALTMEMSAKEAQVINPSANHLINLYSQGHKAHGSKQKQGHVSRSESHQSRSESQGHIQTNRSQSHNSRNRNQSQSSSGTQYISPNRSSRTTNAKLCTRCGVRNHHESQCPAKSWRCYSCNKYGHTSYVCRRNRFNVINAVQPTDSPCEMNVVSSGRSTVVYESRYWCMRFSNFVRYVPLIF